MSMETLKAFAYFRIHPFLSIAIVIVAGIAGVIVFMYSVPTAYGIPFGGSVSFYNPSCNASFVQVSGICTACPQCGQQPTCTGLQELVVSGTGYCPVVGFPFIAGKPKPGGFVLGLAIPAPAPGGVLMPTGVSIP